MILSVVGGGRTVRRSEEGGGGACGGGEGRTDDPLNGWGLRAVGRETAILIFNELPTPKRETDHR